MKTSTTFLALALIATLGLVTASTSFADDANETDAVPESLKITGKGIKNRETEDMTLMACVGEGLISEEIDCGTLRLVKLAKGKTPIFVSYPFKVDDIAQMTQRLALTYSAQEVDSVFNLFHGNTVSAFTSQDGWNWRNNPLELRKDKYEAVVQATMFVAQYNYSKAQEYERKLNESELAGSQGCRVEGNYLAEAKEKGSARSVIYSSTGTEVIFTLCNHGVAKTLKRMQVGADSECLSISGEFYKFKASKALLHATKSAYQGVAHFIGSEDSEGMGVLLYIFVGGLGGAALNELLPTALISWGTAFAAPWVLPVLPAVGAVATVSVDAVITGISTLVDKDAIAARKFHKLVREKNVKMSHNSFESMMAKISAL